MKKQVVKFIPKDLETSMAYPEPRPSKLYTPKWYKDMPSSAPKLSGNQADPTAKKCVPFMDSLISGYTQELGCDLRIMNRGIDPNTGKEIVEYDWAGPFKPMSTRAEDRGSSNVMPNFDGYYNLEFHWNSFWEPKTPPGYSTMYYHPANRFDLPFHTMSGIIDTDNWSITGPVPFLIKKGFSGLIPAGTPIYQMIFIKRDEWHSTKEKYNREFNFFHEYNIKKLFVDSYKRQYWSKKAYY